MVLTARQNDCKTFENHSKRTSHNAKLKIYPD